VRAVTFEGFAVAAVAEELIEGVDTEDEEDEDAGT
jgi:hypothetical protein